MDQKTFAYLLKPAGYTTEHIGKWHLGNPKLPKSPTWFRGFTDSIWFYGQNKLPLQKNYRNDKPETTDERYVDEVMVEDAGSFIISHKDLP